MLTVSRAWWRTVSRVPSPKTSGGNGWIRTWWLDCQLQGQEIKEGEINYR